MRPEILKESTDQEHHDIEGAINFLEVTSSSESYGKLLEKFYGYYLPMERIFLNFSNEFKEINLDVKKRMKKDLLIEDLSLMNRNIDKIPLC